MVKGRVTLAEKLLYTNLKNLYSIVVVTFQDLAWDQDPQWEKRKKEGEI